MNIDEYLATAYSQYQFDFSLVQKDLDHLYRILKIVELEELSIKIIPTFTTAIFPSKIKLNNEHYLLWDQNYWIHYLRFLTQCMLRDNKYGDLDIKRVLLKQDILEILQDLFRNDINISYLINRYLYGYKLMLYELNYDLKPNKEEATWIGQISMTSQIIVMFHELYHISYKIPSNYEKAKEFILEMSNLVKTYANKKHKVYIDALVDNNIEEFACDFFSILHTADILLLENKYEYKKAIQEAFEAYELNMLFLSSCKIAYKVWEQYVNFYKEFSTEGILHVSKNLSHDLDYINYYDSSNNRANLMYLFIRHYVKAHRDITFDTIDYEIYEFVDKTLMEINIHSAGPHQIFYNTAVLDALCEEGVISKEAIKCLTKYVDYDFSIINSAST